jgi:hypothetical protein
MRSINCTKLIPTICNYMGFLLGFDTLTEELQEKALIKTLTRPDPITVLLAEVRHEASRKSSRMATWIDIIRKFFNSITAQLMF